MRKLPLKRKAFYLTLAAMLITFSLPGIVFNQATTTTTNEKVPFVQLVNVPCANGGAGEDVLISGTLHVLTHVTVNGNRAVVKQQFQPQGAKGVGQITGDTYNAVGGTKFQETFPLTNGAATFTYINNFRLIGPGPDNNLQVHQTVHTTVNANGVVTSTVDNTSVDCN